MREQVRVLTIFTMLVKIQPVSCHTNLRYLGKEGAIMEKFHVLIIGGGGTGAAVAHDLALRGMQVTLVERGEVTSGTTGRHPGAGDRAAS